MSPKSTKCSPPDHLAGGFPDLPAELIDEILLRLPVKSLLRFRRVCKSWAALTYSPSFIDAHLNLHSNNNSRHHILCTLPFWNPDHRRSICLLRRGGGAAPLLLDFPPPILFGDLLESEVRACSHRGLVCLWTHCGPIYLWNPSTGEARTVPPSRHRFSRRVRYVWVGLGSVRLGDGSEDYKVVKVVRYKSENTGIKAEVYSLKRDAWRDVAVNSKMSLLCLFKNEVAVANDSVNWIGLQNPSFGFVVVSFDLKSEAFRCIEFSEKGRLFMPRIGVWKGSVGVLAETESGEWEVWVVTGEKSWAKVFVFGPDEEGATPMGFTMGGEVLLSRKGRRMRMIGKQYSCGKNDEVDEEFLLPVDADVGSIMFCCAFCAHTESLVSVYYLPNS